MNVKLEFANYDQVEEFLKARKFVEIPGTKGLIGRLKSGKKNKKSRRNNRIHVIFNSDVINVHVDWNVRGTKPHPTDKKCFQVQVVCKLIKNFDESFRPITWRFRLKSRIRSWLIRFIKSAQDAWEGIAKAGSHGNTHSHTQEDRFKDYGQSSLYASTITVSESSGQEEVLSRK